MILRNTRDVIDMFVFLSMKRFCWVRPTCGRWSLSRLGHLDAQACARQSSVCLDPDRGDDIVVVITTTM